MPESIIRSRSSKWLPKPRHSRSAKMLRFRLALARTWNGCVGTTTASAFSMPSSTRPPFKPLNASRPCAPTTLTPSRTWPSLKSLGKSTTTPSPIWPRRSPFCQAIPAPSITAPLWSATQARLPPPLPTLRPCLPSTPAPATASAS